MFKKADLSLCQLQQINAGNEVVMIWTREEQEMCVDASVRRLTVMGLKRGKRGSTKKYRGEMIRRNMHDIISAHRGHDPWLEGCGDRELG